MSAPRRVAYTTVMKSCDETPDQVCETAAEFLRACRNDNVFERPPADAPIHPYFDIDFKEKAARTASGQPIPFSQDMEPVFLECAERVLIKAFQTFLEGHTPTFCVLSSTSADYLCTDEKTKTKHRTWKVSLHLIVTNVLMYKENVGAFVKKVNKFLQTQEESERLREYGITSGFFDESVYDRRRKIRAVGASKAGENRPLRLVRGTMEESIITNLEPEGSLPVLCFAAEQEPKKAGGARHSEQRDTNYIDKYRDYMALIPREHYDSNYGNWYKLQRASANIGIPFEVYDAFMQGCLSYNYDENWKYYHAPEDNKNGRLGWRHIYELAQEYNPEAKALVDERYGSPLFCKYRFMKIAVEDEEVAEEVAAINEEREKLIRHIAEFGSDEDMSSFERDRKRKAAKKKAEDLDAAHQKVMDDRLYEKRKAYFERFHFKLVSHVCYIRYKEDGYQYLSEEKLRALYRYMDKFIVRWIADIRIREYEAIDFLPPPAVVKRGVFNTYTGMVWEKDADRVARMTDAEVRERCEPFLKHLWYLSGKNNKMLCYLLRYLAHLIQEPGNLPRTAIVFKSEQGCGKNLFFEMFASTVLGEQYLLVTANMDNILGRFPMISNKLLVLMDETNGKDSFMASDRIKSFITSKTVPFEQKGIDAVTIHNFARMGFFTNNDYAVKIEQSDRRFEVTECSSEIKNNTPYFKALMAAFNDRTTAAAFGQFLKRLDISRFDTTNDRPTTKIYKEMQTATVPSEVRYFMEADFCEGDLAEDQSGDAIYRGYTHWCSLSAKKHTPISRQTFLTRIKKHDFVQSAKNAKGNIVYRLLEAPLAAFREAEAAKLEIEDDEEDEFDLAVCV